MPTAAKRKSESSKDLIERVLDEAQRGKSVNKKLCQQLVQCWKAEGPKFLDLFAPYIQAILEVGKHEASIDQLVKFLAHFATSTTAGMEETTMQFLQEFTLLVLTWTRACDRAIRMRSIQLLAEILQQAPMPHIASNLIKKLIPELCLRSRDRVAVVRVWSVRALSSLVPAVAPETLASVIDPCVAALSHDSNAEVRKAAVSCLPVNDGTRLPMLERAADENQAVRKAVYATLGKNLQMQSLRVAERASLLHRGLVEERVPAVRAECSGMLKLWFRKDCGSVIEKLASGLDVRANEDIASVALQELFLHGENVNLQGQKLVNLLESHGVNDESHGLLSEERALIARTWCEFLHAKAEESSQLSASAAGAEAEVAAATAREVYDALENFLPESVVEFVEIVQRHLAAGCSFSVRQLLRLVPFVNLTDAAGCKAAAVLARQLLFQDVPEEDDASAPGFPGLSADPQWAEAVVQLARRVHASPGEFESVMVEGISVLAAPLRSSQDSSEVLSGKWQHCLHVLALLLLQVHSLNALSDLEAMEPQEMLQTIVIPALSHTDPKVRVAGTRCLALYCQLDVTSARTHGWRLRVLMEVDLDISVAVAAVRALFDIVLWHGPRVMDNAGHSLGKGRGKEARSVPAGPGGSMDEGDVTEVGDSTGNDGNPADTVDDTGAGGSGDGTEDRPYLKLTLLEHLKLLLDSELKRSESPEEEDEDEEPEPASWELCEVVMEGFAKVLVSHHHSTGRQVADNKANVLATLAQLQFSEKTKHCPRARQFMEITFGIVAERSVEDKRCLVQALGLVLDEWSLDDRASGQARRARRSEPDNKQRTSANVCKYLLHLLEVDIRSSGAKAGEPSSPTSMRDAMGSGPREWEASHRAGSSSEMGSAAGATGGEWDDWGQAPLALKIIDKAVHANQRSPSWREAMSTLCSLLIGLHFEASDQQLIKAVRHALPGLLRRVQWSKPTVKQLSSLAKRLLSLDTLPGEGLSEADLDALCARFNLQGFGSPAPYAEDDGAAGPPGTAVRRRRRRCSSPSSADTFAAPTPPTATQTPAPSSLRPQRRCKQAAIVAMSMRKSAAFENLTSESDSDSESGSSHSTMSVELPRASNSPVSEAKPTGSRRLSKDSPPPQARPARRPTPPATSPPHEEQVPLPSQPAKQSPSPLQASPKPRLLSPVAAAPRAAPRSQPKKMFVPDSESEEEQPVQWRRGARKSVRPQALEDSSEDEQQQQQQQKREPVPNSTSEEEEEAPLKFPRARAAATGPATSSGRGEPGIGSASATGDFSQATHHGSAAPKQDAAVEESQEQQGPVPDAWTVYTQALKKSIEESQMPDASAPEISTEDDYASAFEEDETATEAVETEAVESDKSEVDEAAVAFQRLAVSAKDESTQGTSPSGWTAVDKVATEGTSSRPRENPEAVSFSEEGGLGGGRESEEGHRGGGPPGESAGDVADLEEYKDEGWESDESEQGEGGSDDDYELPTPGRRGG